MFMKLLHLELQICIVARKLYNVIVAGGENLPATFVFAAPLNNNNTSFALNNNNTSFALLLRLDATDKHLKLI